MSVKRKKGKKKSSPRKSNHGLLGLIGISDSHAGNIGKLSKGEILKLGASAGAGALVGAIAPSQIPSGWLGLGLVGIGIWKKKPYLTLAGAGMLVGMGGKTAYDKAMNGRESSIEGFSLSEATSEAKDKIGNFAKAFMDKFQMPKLSATSSATTNGVGDANAVGDTSRQTIEGNEQGTYFISPFKASTREPDLSALNSLEKSVDNISGIFGLGSPEREL